MSKEFRVLVAFDVAGISRVLSTDADWFKDFLDGYGGGDADLLMCNNSPDQGVWLWTGTAENVWDYEGLDCETEFTGKWTEVDLGSSQFAELFAMTEKHEDDDRCDDDPPLRLS